MATVERTLTINVRHAVIKVPAYRRAKKAVTAVREFLQQHMKSENVKLGKYLNLKLWEHGIKNPAMRVTVVAKKDDKGVVTAELPNILVKKQRPVKVKGKRAETPKAVKGKAETTTPTAAAATPAATTAKTA
ncbi:60S ribosomal protein L31 [Candidatus Woesearchaeota archaeon]|nr:60S ribosomal protein L31 [Candidatus Woesearchaeota archaeon]